MGVLRIFLFGPMRLHHEGHRPVPKMTRTLQSLFAYLLLQGKSAHSREVLAGLFWGEHPETRARNCLNTALWRLRRLLEPDGIAPGAYLLSDASGEVSFNWNSEHWFDVENFEEQATHLLALSAHEMTAAQATMLAQALTLYKSDLLEGSYDDWALRERERLRLLYLKSLTHLARYHKQHQAYDESITYCQRILLQDPLREEIHRELMRLYLLNGQRALAVQQYKICLQVLDKELSLPPMEETQTLYYHLLSGESRQPRETSPAPTSDSLFQAVEELRQAARDLDHAREKIQRAVRHLERLPTTSTPRGKKRSERAL